MSVRNHIMKTIVKFSGMRTVCNMTPDELKEYVRNKKQSAKPPKFITKRYLVKTITMQQAVCYEIKPQPKNESGHRCIIAIHGGAYFLEIGAFNWKVISKIIDSTYATVYVPIYPLCPEHTYKETFPFLNQLYQYICKSYAPSCITVIGDSAGGQISLSFCQFLAKQQLPQPKTCILLSPLLTLTPTDEQKEQMKRIEHRDCLLRSHIIDLIAALWVPDGETSHYLVSPLHGTFTELADIVLFMGTDEILAPFVDELLKKAEEGHTNITYYKGTHMMHTWPLFPLIPEAKKALKEIIQIIKSDR